MHQEHYTPLASLLLSVNLVRGVCQKEHFRAPWMPALSPATIVHNLRARALKMAKGGLEAWAGACKRAHPAAPAWTSTILYSATCWLKFCHIFDAQSSACKPETVDVSGPPQSTGGRRLAEKKNDDVNAGRHCRPLKKSSSAQTLV